MKNEKRIPTEQEAIELCRTTNIDVLAELYGVSKATIYRARMEGRISLRTRRKLAGCMEDEFLKKARATYVPRNARSQNAEVYRLADLTGLGTGVVHRYLTGKTVSPTTKALLDEATATAEKVELPTDEEVRRYLRRFQQKDISELTGISVYRLRQAARANKIAVKLKWDIRDYVWAWMEQPKGEA